MTPATCLSARVARQRLTKNAKMNILLALSLLLGSFLNVCIYRIPRGESIAYPPSHCRACGHRLTARELVPLLSWLWQRGRCRHCGAAISWRYPLVELLTAVLLTLVYLRFGWSWATVYWSAITALLIVISFIDLDTLEIPTELVMGGAVLATAYNCFSRRPFAEWALGGLLGFGLFYLIYHLSRGGMGGGDVRLAGLLGLALGWRQLLLALFISFTSGAVIALLLLLTGRAKRGDPIPFGPFLAAGGYLAALWGEQIVRWYLGLFF